MPETRERYILLSEIQANASGYRSCTFRNVKSKKFHVNSIGFQLMESSRLRGNSHFPRFRSMEKLRDRCLGCIFTETAFGLSIYFNAQN